MRIQETLFVAVTFGVLVACATAPTGPRTTNEFQGVVPALQAKAKQAVQGTPDNVLVIGYVQTTPNGPKNLTYIPSELHVPRGTTVGWVSWDGSFTLTFYPTPSAPDWPFDSPEAPIASGGNPNSAARTVSQSAKQNVRFHFRVALTLPSGETLHDDQCPPIIVE